MGPGPEVRGGGRVFPLPAFVRAGILANYAILGYFLGRGKGDWTDAATLINGVNIALSIFLGLYLGWGVMGVAWDAVGRSGRGAIGLAIVLDRFRACPAGRQSSFTRRREAAVRAEPRYHDPLLRSDWRIHAFYTYRSLLGTVTLAANAVLMPFFLVAGYFLDGFPTAAEQLTGRASARGMRRPLTGAEDDVHLGIRAGGFTTVAVLIFGDKLVDRHDGRRRAGGGGAYLPWAAFTRHAGAGVPDGWRLYRRHLVAGHAQHDASSFSHFVVALCLLVRFGNHGLWAALHIFLIARGLSLLSIMPRRARAAFAV